MNDFEFLFRAPSYKFSITIIGSKPIDGKNIYFFAVKF